MHVESSRFGTIDVPDDEVVTFPDGLPGFPTVRHMALLGAGQMPGGAEMSAHHTLFWLHDLDDPDLAFLTIVPWSAYPDYDIEIEPDDVDGADADDLSILAIVTVRRDDVGGVRLTSNLLAPVVIDTARRIGRQLILQDATWPVHAPLAELGTTAGAT
jgi:flagellar assembly factor FliW